MKILVFHKMLCSVLNWFCSNPLLTVLLNLADLKIFIWVVKFILKVMEEIICKYVNLVVHSYRFRLTEGDGVDPTTCLRY